MNPDFSLSSRRIGTRNLIMWNKVAASWHQSMLLLLTKHKTKTKGNPWNQSGIDRAKMPRQLQCAVPENIHTPPTEGIGISWEIKEMYQA